MPWGTRFKLREDDAILAKLAQCDLYELGYILEVFSAESTVRGNGPKSTNFGMPLDFKATKKYIDLMLTIQSADINSDESDRSSEDDESDSSSEDLHMPELEYVFNDGNGQSTHVSPQ